MYHFSFLSIFTFYFLSISGTLFTYQVNAQEMEYADLLVLFVEEEYEKCLKKSIKYTQKDKTKKHPLPYLYASLTYYEISRDHQFHDTYPKAFKQCLSYAIKYRRKDEYLAYRDDSETHLEKLKLILAEEIDNYQLDQSPRANRKITSILKKLSRLDPDDFGVTILRGLYEIKNNNRTEGRKYLTKGLDSIKSDYLGENFELLSESQQHFFKIALIESGEYYISKDLTKAKNIIRMGEPFFLGNNQDCILENLDDFKKIFEEVLG
jgi:hypothetical protein